MIDAEALARELGSEKMWALAEAIIAGAEGRNGPKRNSPSAISLRAAAERLAAPEKVEPKWPERAWAVFDPELGMFERAMPYRDAISNVSLILCRVVPADAVVLDRETVERAILTVRAAQATAVGVYMQTHLNELLTDLRRAAGGAPDA